MKAIGQLKRIIQWTWEELPLPIILYLCLLIVGWGWIELMVPGLIEEKVATLLIIILTPITYLIASFFLYANILAVLGICQYLFRHIVNFYSLIFDEMKLLNSNNWNKQEDYFYIILLLGLLPLIILTVWLS